ncbi:hypothetical protein IFM46972_11483 [Aspergillus udagawae]|uniref:Uncharacterized protein n=1 Tax=Aspergillus udagawae TaxID=91492 RepID=A0A8H3XRZ7_9EURO|nr:hypothetical protein IFM46972_11483 [Aspergillus udagawae]
MAEAKKKVHSQYRNARNGAMLVEPVSMGMRSKSVIPVRSNDCAFLFIIPGQSPKKDANTANDDISDTHERILSPNDSSGGDED